MSNKNSFNPEDRKEDLYQGLTDADRLRNIRGYIARVLYYRYDSDSETTEEDMKTEDAIRFCLVKITENCGAVRSITKTKYSDFPWMSVGLAAHHSWEEEFESYILKVLDYCFNRIVNIVEIEDGFSTNNMPLSTGLWISDASDLPLSTSPTTVKSAKQNRDETRLREYRDGIATTASVWTVKKR